MYIHSSSFTIYLFDYAGSSLTMHGPLSSCAARFLSAGTSLVARSVVSGPNGLW